MSVLIDQAIKLPVPERIKLIGDIWDSIADEQGSIELTPEQKAELDRRIEDYQLHPDDFSTWEDVRERLFKRG